MWQDLSFVPLSVSYHFYVVLGAIPNIFGDIQPIVLIG